MLLFGHIGITVGIAYACDVFADRSGNNHEPNPGSRLSVTVHKILLTLRRALDRVRHRLGSIDYRVVLLGSLLPDILDKPLWLFASGGSWPSGRAWGHTFLFNFLLFVVGLILIRYRKSWLVVISLSSFIHLVLDQMWANPVVLWWPLLGPFQRAGTAGWMPDIIHSLFSNASTYIPEIIGLVVILLLGYRLLLNKDITGFIKEGHLSVRRNSRHLMTAKVMPQSGT